MLNPFSYAKRFFFWWIQNLQSCLPEKWVSFLSGARARYDLVITHQGDSILVVTDQGEVLDGVSQCENSTFDVTSLAAEETAGPRFSNTQLRAAAKLVPDRDPPLSLDADSPDIDVTDSGDDFDVEKLDLLLGDTGQGPGDRAAATQLFDPANMGNVFSLKIQRDDDATVLLEGPDETTQFLDSDSEEDTVILKSDQGKLLQFESGGPEVRNSTVLFHNYGGKIRRVDSSDSDSQVSGGNDQSPLSHFEDRVSDTDSSDYVVVSKLLGVHQGNKRCLYLLPDSKVLVLNLSFPIEAIQDIDTVLRYDLEKHIPSSEQEVRYFYALNFDPGREKVNVEVAVIKSEQYDILNLALAPFLEAGLLCTTERFYTKYGSKINFLEQTAKRDWRAFFKFSNLHLTFNWALLLLLLVTPYLALYSGFESIEAKSADEVSRVTELVSDFNATRAESSYGSMLLEQINKTPRTTEMLSVFSTHINKQAWLHQFSYKKNEFKIKGEAESATAVSDDLNGTGLFQSIKFVSSIVKNARSGKESFELLLMLKPDA